MKIKTKFLLPKFIQVKQRNGFSFMMLSAVWTAQRKKVPRAPEQMFRDNNWEHFHKRCWQTWFLHSSKAFLNKTFKIICLRLKIIVWRLFLLTKSPPLQIWQQDNRRKKKKKKKKRINENKLPFDICKVARREKMRINVEIRLIFIGAYQQQQQRLLLEKEIWTKKM